MESTTIFFSVIILTDEKDDLLIKCLHSLRPENINWELILVGHGEEVPQTIRESISAPHFTYVKEDDSQHSAKKRNSALELAQGEWIFFLDQKTSLLPGYWKTVMTLLNESKIDVISGPEIPTSAMSKMDFSICLALSSPLCTGPCYARFKPVGSQLQHAEEEKLNISQLWVRKKVISDVRFSEYKHKGDVAHFLLDLKSHGARFFYHPKMRVTHLRTRDIFPVLKESFQAGFFRSSLMLKKNNDAQGLFWLPSVFILLHGLYFMDAPLFWNLARMYLSLVLFMSISLSMKVKKTSLFPFVTLLHYLIVFSFGLGFLSQRVKKSKTL
jgi:hypothetical protein